jgi:glycosyltransferase involved in cell wall biosynthesis
MKIGIDGAPLAIPFPCGTKQYAEQLITSLVEVDDENDYIIFSSADVHLPEKKNISLVRITQNLPILKRQLFLTMAVKKYQIDVFQYLEPYGSMFLSHPNIITTIHDVDLNQTYPWKSAYWLSRVYTETTRSMVAQKTRQFITISKTIQHEWNAWLLYRQLHKPIKTIYQGLNSEFFPRKRFIKPTYWLAMGDFTKRKNVLTVMAAYASLDKKIQRQFRLKVVVSSRKFLTRYLDERHRLGLDDSVDLITGVSQTQLRHLYQSAIAFIYPSLYEGFGLPILEAMACGCPVITSNYGAMKEVAGKAALLVEPLSTQKICEAMLIVTQNDTLRKKLVDLGIQRARLFSWQKTALETLKVYRRMYDAR